MRIINEYLLPSSVRNGMDTSWRMNRYIEVAGGRIFEPYSHGYVPVDREKFDNLQDNAEVNYQKYIK